MKISGDNRILSHFFKDEKSPVYTIIYPPQHTLKERIDYIDELLVEMKMALKKEEELKAEHGKYLEAGGKLEKFDEWLKEKFEKEKAAAEKAKVEEVKEVPIVEPKPTLPVEDAVIEETKKVLNSEAGGVGEI